MQGVKAAQIVRDDWENVKSILDDNPTLPKIAANLSTGFIMALALA